MYDKSTNKSRSQSKSKSHSNLELEKPEKYETKNDDSN